MTIHTFPLIFSLVSCLFLSSHAVGTDPRWLVPDGSKADLSTSFYTGNSITVSWLGLNASVCDLWLTSFNTSHDYATRIASNIDITNTGTLPWTIDVSNEQIEIDDQFVLRFIPTGTAYSYALQFVQAASPGFLILAKPAAAVGATSSAGTSSSVLTFATGAGSSGVTETAAASTMAGSPTSTSIVAAPASPISTLGATPSSPPSSGGISTGVKAGAAIAAVAAVCVIIALLLWVIRLRRRVKAAANSRSQGVIDDGSSTAKPPDMEMTPHGKGLSVVHEVNGDRRQPVEMSTQKERNTLYEMPG